MAGIETIVKYGCLSDEQRWKTNRYEFKWLSELDDHDLRIIGLLDCLSEGEFSGQASAAQLFELMIREKDNGYPDHLASDWGELFAYVNIIVYEELRHGLSLGKCVHYAKHGNFDFEASIDRRAFGQKYLWCYEDRRYWDLYSYVLAHLFGEVINTELYRDIRVQVHHESLKELITNIMSDEARHERAWTELIRNLIQADPEHKKRALKTIERGLTYHNAMVHETYFEGMNKMIPLFIPSTDEKPGAIDRIINRKHRILVELFGEDCPYTRDEIQQIHSKFLARSLGETRAVYSPDAEGNISFLSGSAA